MLKKSACASLTNLDNHIKALSSDIKKMNECKSVDDLLLVEARCRELYYSAFNVILEAPEFVFSKRTKQPPMDKINALISFGNTLLYNRFQQLIWKTSLDSRIGVFHAANKRHYSLNLDFADLFKPIIVDRIIFSLINRKQLNRDSFEQRENGAVYLSSTGKRIFIEQFEEKMRGHINIDDKTITYNALLVNELRNFLNFILTESPYKPYKYY